MNDQSGSLDVSADKLLEALAAERDLWRDLFNRYAYWDMIHPAGLTQAESDAVASLLTEDDSLLLRLKGDDNDD